MKTADNPAKVRLRTICLLLTVLFISAAVFTACTPAGEQPAAGTSPDADNASPAATSGEVFIVGMECNYPPFNWTQFEESTGSVPIEGGGFANGYDVQIAKRIAEGLGKTLVISKIKWEGLEPALTSGKIDAIIAGMSPTEDRKQSIDFSENYYNSDLVIVVKKDGPFAGATSLEDFKGAKITAQLNTFHYSVIDQIPEVAKQVAMDTFPLMITSLSSGKIDGYVSERPGAMSAMGTNPDLAYISFAEGQGFKYSMEDSAIAVGLKKGDPLKDSISAEITKIDENQRNELMLDAIANQPSAE